MFFLPDVDETSAPLPWLKRPGEFEQDCTQCGDCIGVCETDIIKKDPNGFPGVSFAANECTFCYACAEACAEPIFLPRDDQPWQRVAEMTGDCLARKNVECRSCGEACGPMAIRFKLEIGSVAQPYIDDDSCTGCGGCVSVCPVDAINVSG